MVAANIPQDRIAVFCKRHHIKTLSLFGSVLTDEFDNDSDIDVLVEFEDGHTPGLSFFSMQEELSQILGRKADLCTPKFLSRYIRKRVQSTAEVQYAL